MSISMHIVIIDYKVKFMLLYHVEENISPESNRTQNETFKNNINTVFLKVRS